MATYVTTNANTNSTPVGDVIYAQFNSATNTAAVAVNSAIDASAANPGDPTSMIKMQVALANYNLALSVQSSVIKSLEETAKSITQKL
jgi:type III secretion apparatus needle protein